MSGLEWGWSACSWTFNAELESIPYMIFRFGPGFALPTEPAGPGMRSHP